jgi:hypothetical protein
MICSGVVGKLTRTCVEIDNKVQSASIGSLGYRLHVSSMLRCIFVRFPDVPQEEKVVQVNSGACGPSGERYEAVNELRSWRRSRII